MLLGQFLLGSRTGYALAADGLQSFTIAAVHVKSITIPYTAEIELRPAVGGTVGVKPDPETGTGF